MDSSIGSVGAYSYGYVRTTPTNMTLNNGRPSEPADGNEFDLVFEDMANMVENLLLIDHPGPLTSFTIFPRLPVEMQLKIWEYSIRGRGILVYGQSDGQNQWSADPEVPAILKTCKRSRDVGLKNYTLFPSIQEYEASPSAVKPRYFNFDIDMFGPIGGVGRLPTYIMPLVKHLMVDAVDLQRLLMEISPSYSDHKNWLYSRYGPQKGDQIMQAGIGSCYSMVAGHPDLRLKTVTLVWRFPICIDPSTEHFVLAPCHPDSKTLKLQAQIEESLKVLTKIKDDVEIGWLYRRYMTLWTGELPKLEVANAVPEGYVEELDD